MTSHTLRRPLTWVLVSSALAAGSTAHAANGFMAFLSNGPGGTTVTAGTAESYMRASRDWDRVTLDPTNTFALPAIILTPTITTWKDATSLHFKFVIADATKDKPDGTSLACGDQLIVQIGPANTAATTLAQGQEFRYELAIIGSLLPNGLKLRLPRPAADPLVGRWKAAVEASTGGTATLTIVGNAYNVDVTIPLSEVGNPAGDFGLAIALINDLGHSHPTNQNEASGTAFPVGMGLTPESDPGLTCGTLTSPGGETATGNWINPSTWGVGFTALSTTPNVTFDQGPAGWVSRAIRLGRCSVTDFNAIPEVTTANWASVQTAVGGNWYKFDGQNPCKMTIWMNATVSPPGSVQKRFVAVWGRPGISPQGWFFAGITNPVTVSSPTTAVSFVWNKPPAASFSDHPCLRIYVLPLPPYTGAQDTALAALIADTSGTNTALSNFETAFNVSGGNGLAAQMNFANFNNATSCSESVCMPTASLKRPGEGLLARWSPFAILHAQDRGDERDSLIRIVAHGFGVADPASNKPYMFIEDIGGLGWSVSNQMLAQAGSIPLKLQVSNPAITERMFANGAPVDVRSPNRRIFVKAVVSVVPGTREPRLDLSALNRFAETPLTPGQTFDSQIVISAVGGLPPWWMKWWWLILLVLLIIAIILYLARRPATP